jgi:CubicO group peptidase (beta-lactamase class C family)
MKTKIDYQKLLILAILIGTIFSCKQKPKDESVVRDKKYKESLLKVYENLGVFCNLNSIPGLAVAVSIDNKVVLADGFGYSSVEMKTKVSPSHLFRVGQLSQIITSLTAAKLSEEGKISLDKPVHELFPALNLKSPSYSLYQLGVQSSGVVPEGRNQQNTKSKLPEEYFASILAQPLAFEPGSDISKSDANFDLMGYFLQKATGKPLNEIIKENFTNKLGLTGTKLDNPYTIFDKKSSQYDYTFLGLPGIAPLVDLSLEEASSGYLSTVLDLVKIGNTLIYPGYLKKETLDSITKPYVTSIGRQTVFGFGFIVNKNTREQVFYGQKGVVTGGSSALLVIPEDKIVVAMTANIGNSLWELPVFAVAEIFQKQMHPDWEAQKEEKTSEKQEQQKQK